MTQAIVMKDVKISYGDKVVLNGIDLIVEKGQVLAIIGASGSGKSTILRMLIGLMQPTSGTITIDGEQVENYTEEQWNKLRQKMGMVFQYSALFDSMTVVENVAFGLRQHTDKSDDEILQIVKTNLQLVGLEGYENYMPSELSGGMKKRVSLARTISTNPEILLYDEPTAGLDPVMSDVINKLMLKTKQLFKVTSVLVTHDMYSAFFVADKIAMIDNGLIIEQGTPKEILKSDNSIVKRFVDKALPLGGLLDEK